MAMRRTAYVKIQKGKKDSDGTAREAHEKGRLRGKQPPLQQAREPTTELIRPIASFANRHIRSESLVSHEHRI